MTQSPAHAYYIPFQQQASSEEQLFTPPLEDDSISRYNFEREDIILSNAEMPQREEKSSNAGYSTNRSFEKPTTTFSNRQSKRGLQWKTQMSPDSMRRKHKKRLKTRPSDDSPNQNGKVSRQEIPQSRGLDAITPKITRGVILRQGDFMVPTSTANKLVFVSNTSGNGFILNWDSQSDDLANRDIPLRQMIEEVNKKCESRWIEGACQPTNSGFRIFEKLAYIFLLLVMLTLIIIFIQSDRETLNGMTKLFSLTVILIAFTLITALSVYCFPFIGRDLDKEIVEIIKEELYRMNTEEEQERPMRQRWRWTYQADCLWIALEIMESGLWEDSHEKIV